MTETATNNPPTHTTRLAPLDVIKWSRVPPRMTFPVNGRPPPLQYEYQSIILYTLWCTSVDVWLPLLFHRRLPVTNWEERDSANFNMYLCPCLSVFAFLCVYLSKYNWIQKKIPDRKRWAAGGPFQFQIWAGVGRWVGFLGGFSFATTHHQLQFRANWRGPHWSFWFLAGISWDILHLWMHLYICVWLCVFVQDPRDQSRRERSCKLPVKAVGNDLFLVDIDKRANLWWRTPPFFKELIELHKTVRGQGLCKYAMCICGLVWEGFYPIVVDNRSSFWYQTSKPLFGC